MHPNTPIPAIWRVLLTNNPHLQDMAISYKWKPNKKQKAEFKAKMADPEFSAVYYQRQADKAAKKRATSTFDYTTAGGMYMATKVQHDFCLQNSELFQTIEEQSARNQVIYSYTCSEKIHHDNIHIVNEKIRFNHK